MRALSPGLERGQLPFKGTCFLSGLEGEAPGSRGWQRRAESCRLRQAAPGPSRRGTKGTRVPHSAPKAPLSADPTAAAGPSTPETENLSPDSAQLTHLEKASAETWRRRLPGAPGTVTKFKPKLAFSATYIIGCRSADVITSDVA